MNVYMLGNASVQEDTAPIRLLPDLKRRFPGLSFVLVDPTENFIPEDGDIIVDTVSGISEPALYIDIGAFEQTRSVSPHDYDLGFHLRLLLKLKKITRVAIVGIPQSCTIDAILPLFTRLATMR